MAGPSRADGGCLRGERAGRPVTHVAGRWNDLDHHDGGAATTAPTGDRCPGGRHRSQCDVPGPQAGRAGSNGPARRALLILFPNSFPSGHVTAVASIAVGTLLVVPPLLRAPVVIASAVVVAVVGVSTLMAGWHRMADAVVAPSWRPAGAPLPRPSSPGDGAWDSWARGLLSSDEWAPNLGRDRGGNGGSGGLAYFIAAVDPLGVLLYLVDQGGSPALFIVGVIIIAGSFLPIARCARVGAPRRPPGPPPHARGRAGRSSVNTRLSSGGDLLSRHPPPHPPGGRVGVHWPRHALLMRARFLLAAAVAVAGSGLAAGCVPRPDPGSLPPTLDDRDRTEWPGGDAERDRGPDV